MPVFLISVTDQQDLHNIKRKRNNGRAGFEMILFLPQITQIGTEKFCVICGIFLPNPQKRKSAKKVSLRFI